MAVSALVCEAKVVQMTTFWSKEKAKGKGHEEKNEEVKDWKR